jgi:hypothetical protein
VSDKRNYSKIVKPKNSSKTGLSETEKWKTFFFGPFIILVAGTRVFYNLPGNEKQKKQTITYFIAGVLFWIFIGVSIYLLE